MMTLLMGDLPPMTAEDAAKGFTFEEWVYLGLRYSGTSAKLVHHWLKPDGRLDVWDAEKRADRAPFGKSFAPGAVVRVMLRRDDKAVYVRTTGEFAPTFLRRDPADPPVVEWTALHRAALRDHARAKAADRDADRDALREWLKPLRAAYWQLATPWQRAAFISDICGIIMGGTDPKKEKK